MTAIQWKDKQEEIENILKLRAEGYSLREVANVTAKRLKRKCTVNQIYHVILTYGPDAEIDDSVTGKSLVTTRRSQINAREANAKVRKIADLVMSQDDVLKEFRKLVKSVKSRKPVKKRKKKKGSTDMTVELLFSDWQVGKRSANYNSDIAIKRIKEYSKCAVDEILRKADQGYNVERIVLVLLGDIIESAEKATQKGSPGSVDCSTPEQLRLSIQHLFLDVIAPLAELGCELEVVAVPGNHDHIGPGIIHYNPGKEHMSWTIYKSLELLSEQSGLDVSFNVPEGYFTTVDYYGQTALYEHGYGLAATETALNNRRNERMRQMQKYISYFRMGDKHNICRFNDDSLVVNGAFFGADDTGSEYSSIAGYSSIASQLMFFHVPRRDERKTIYDSYSIQLHHIK